MTRSGLHMALAVIVAAALGVSACGRKGPLERPPAAASAQGQSSPAPVDERPFILDRLLR